MGQKKAEEEAFSERELENDAPPHPIRVGKAGDQIGSHEREE